ncbi:alpha/beta hydrolase family protein [Fimbriiglobus ruber]|uniref:Alpha/beta hydrolase n=1 Tax=Fimbriiglobus ruber TaxID=1908690 RepID=A0A225DFY9_9BACT|nr:hypothetical protein [Fimbriiglobus ruber]OWK36079.1 hypothetical protein FRUB_08642 [Fimbriiglobus ruber]
MSLRRLLIAALAVALCGQVGRAQDKKDDANKPEEKSFKSADGVKLRGLFYKSAKGGSAPVIIMLHAYKADPDDTKWDDTARLLVQQGYNVFRFDFRGHGKSTDIDPDVFWTFGDNKQYVKIPPGFTPATKNTINFKEFSPAYYPMLVQDIAAARSTLDMMNDNGEVNTSTIYLLGAGDAVSLGIFYAASEWYREGKKPNVALAANVVSRNRLLFPDAEPAGQDIGGGIWLGPTFQGTKFTTEILKGIVLSQYAIKMRNETPMLFISGSKDNDGKKTGNAIFNTVLMANAKIYNGIKLLRPEQTFVKEIKDSDARGTKLLGNNIGTEKMIEDFLTAVSKERKDRPRKQRGWEKPMYIDINSFGVMRGN